MASKETILVTGATGQQGGSVIRALLQAGQPVRALTRNPAKAAELNQQGAEVVAADLTDRRSLDAALRGIRKVFLVTTPFEKGMEDEVKQGITMVDAAKEAGVNHLVFNSVGSADRKTGIPHFETKWKVELHLRLQNLPSTIIRPVFFMENFGAPWMLPAIQKGKLVFGLPPNRKLAMVALRDIGAFVAAAFLRPKDFLGQAIDLAGDELTIPEALAILSQKSGKKVGYEQLPDDQMEQAMGHDFAVMFRWFNEVGYRIDIPGLQRRWGIPLTRFSEWVSSSGWIEKMKEAA